MKALIAPNFIYTYIALYICRKDKLHFHCDRMSGKWGLLQGLGYDIYF